MLQTTLTRMLSVSVAFFVFGFIDNVLMVLFGERIDAGFQSIGVSNTLLAAGLGNTLSDAVGIMSGRYVEGMVHRRVPKVAEGELSQFQVVSAEAIGIISGCLVGLFPLLWL